MREQGGRLVGWALGASIARRVLATVNAELDKMSPDGSELLDARSQWKDGAAYDRAAEELSVRFRKNFEKFGQVADHILEAAPA